MKRPVDGGRDLASNPFGGLDGLSLPSAPAQAPKPPPPQPAPRNRGRVDIRRETAGRGGKTVTLIHNFKGIGLPEKEALAREIRNRCGCGGSVKDGAIEIQGDKRDEAADVLRKHGFNPVLTGG
jgi:translation initiation factor 1